MRKIILTAGLIAVATWCFGDYTVTLSDYNTYAGRHDELIQEKVDDGHIEITMPDLGLYNTKLI